MKTLIPIMCAVICLAGLLEGQSQRLWVLRAPGEAVEYDPATFAEKRRVKIPAEAVTSPQNFSVNSLGQMLFAPPSDLPLGEDDVAAGQKLWLWDGHAVVTLTREVSRHWPPWDRICNRRGDGRAFSGGRRNSSLLVADQARRLQRDGVDLSTKSTWSAWRTDLAGGKREDLASTALPECSCPTGGCEETCPYGKVWAPKDGVSNFFLVSMFAGRQDRESTNPFFLYQETEGSWDGELRTAPWM